jgi:hypothetical protein
VCPPPLGLINIYIKEKKNNKKTDRQTKINKENKNLSAVFSQEHTQMC